MLIRNTVNINEHDATLTLIWHYQCITYCQCYLCNNFITIFYPPQKNGICRYYRKWKQWEKNV